MAIGRRLRNNTRSIASLACYPSRARRLIIVIASWMSDRGSSPGTREDGPHPEEVSRRGPTRTLRTPSAGSTARRPAAGDRRPARSLFPGLSPAEEALVTRPASSEGCLSAEQVRAAQLYGHEHNRDLRQSILELNLISPELLNQLAFERLTALATDDNGQARHGDRRRAGRRTPALARPHPAPSRRPQGAPGEGSSPSPSRSWSTRSCERACDCRGHRHPFRSAGERPAGPVPDRRPAPGHPLRRARHGHADDQPAQDHVQPEHRRAPALAGRPDHDSAPQPAPRPAAWRPSRRSSARRSSSGFTRS